MYTLTYSVFRLVHQKGIRKYISQTNDQIQSISMEKYNFDIEKEKKKIKNLKKEYKSK